MSKLISYLYCYLGLGKKYEGLKSILLGLCFFIVLGAYTIIKEIKDSIFCLIVGQSYLPEAKNISYLIMIPLVFFYSWLASKIRKEHLLVFYSILYGLGGLIIAYYLGDPLVGFYNKISSSSRIFGWISYLFLEGFSPFMVSVVWAYFNSISQPEEVKNKYIFMVICSKVGGVISAGISWMIMDKYIIFNFIKDDVSMYVYIMGFASAALLLIPIIIFYMIYKIPHNNLRGYSDDYVQNNKKEDETNKTDGSGFQLLFKYPYILGIFGMVFFWEVVNVVFNYMRLTIGLKESNSISDFGAFLYKNAMLAHLVGFFIAALGTSSLVNFFGQKISLMLIPLFTGGAILGCLYLQTTYIVIATYIFIRAVNYSFAWPLREALYIPTTDSIKFKSKAWVDGFGSKISKAFGSLYNKCIQFIPISFLMHFQFTFFLIIIILWTCLANFMGKKWENSINSKKVIGDT